MGCSVFGPQDHHSHFGTCLFPSIITGWWARGSPALFTKYPSTSASVCEEDTDTDSMTSTAPTRRANRKSIIPLPLDDIVEVAPAVPIKAYYTYVVVGRIRVGSVDKSLILHPIFALRNTHGVRPISEGKCCMRRRNDAHDN